MAKDRQKMLANENISKLLLKLSIPASFGMVAQALYNVVDAIFIGRGVGPMGIAGIAVAFPIQMLIMGIAQVIGIGSASLISRSLGKNNIDDAEKTLGNLFSLTLISGILITIFGLIFLDPILKLFGATDAILPYSHSYMSVILFGSLFSIFSMSANNVVRAEGNAKVSMLAMFIGAILNMALDPLFIFGFHLGIKGAAIATVLSKVVTTIWLLNYIFNGNSLMRFHLKNLKLFKNIITEIFAIGISSFVRTASGSILAGILNHLLVFYGGNIAITIYGLTNRLTSFFLMFVMGVGQGFQPIVGFNYGAKNYKRTKQSIYYAILYATIISTAGFAILQLFAPQLLSMFTKDASLISNSIAPLRIMSLLFPVMGFTIIVSTLFQAIGKAVPALILSLSRQILFLLPLVLILPKFYGLNGIWLSFPGAGIFNFILCTVMLFFEIKKIKEIESVPESDVQV